MPFGSSDKIEGNEVKQNFEDELSYQNEVLTSKVKELECVIAEMRAREEKDFNVEVKRERLCQVSLKIFPHILGRWELPSDALKESKRLAKKLLEEEN